MAGPFHGWNVTKADGTKVEVRDSPDTTDTVVRENGILIVTKDGVTTEYSPSGWANCEHRP